VTRTALALALCACAHATTAFGAQCSVEAVTMNFGAYVGAQVNSVQNIRITCSATLPPPEKVAYEVRLSPGSSNSFAQRRMQRAGAPLDTLPYNLYLGSVPSVLNTSVWGDGSGGTRVWQGNMTLSTGQTTRTETNTIAAALPAGTVPASGAYGDTVIATIVFR
jgi:spore coat protein U-like protein